MRGYELHPRAILDLENILGRIATDSPDAAHRVSSEFRSTLEMLARFQNAGHLRPDLISRLLRFHTVREYLIAYAPDDPLWVVAVLHGRRNPRILASILRSRK